MISNIMDGFRRLPLSGTEIYMKMDILKKCEVKQ